VFIKNLPSNNIIDATFDACPHKLVDLHDLTRLPEDCKADYFGWPIPARVWWFLDGTMPNTKTQFTMNHKCNATERSTTE
jgi:hypothetical protein